MNAAIGFIFVFEKYIFSELRIRKAIIAKNVDYLTLIVEIRRRDVSPNN
jgi:hypothetical protein